ncbi:MAG: helix-turn-helix domain-containing protein [bacterium]
MERAPPDQADDAQPVESTLDDDVKRSKRESIERVMAQTGGNVAQAAAKLGILRTSLYRILKRYGIDAASRSETASGYQPTNQQIER